MRKPPFELVASEGRFEDRGVKQITDEEGESCAYVLAPLCTDPAVKVEETSGRTNCVACGEEVWLSAKDPVRPPRLCVPCALAMWQDGVQ